MNPLFFVATFTALILYSVLSLPWLQQQKTARLYGVNGLCLITFLGLGWQINHLSIYKVFLYFALWAASYWVAQQIPTKYFLTGRAILATLISSVILYLTSKISLLYFLRQGWIGNVTTFFFLIGEILFLAILIFFTADSLRAVNLHLDPRPLPSHVDRGYTPFVSIHLPICNEPVEVVTQTLKALAKLSYPAYEVIVIDNNTHDSALWRPIEGACRQLGFTFKHVDFLRGYKAGALNLALSLTSPKAELVAVVDADYQLAADFLKDNTAAFSNPQVGFLQTAQRNRNFLSNAITRSFNPVYDFFYDITMLARSRRNSIIFAGCAGLIRLAALKKVNGWAEWSITEDAELSLRLLARGYQSIYINRSYGSGLMPETFDAVRKQWFRYFFGGLDITVRHMRSTILARNRLTLLQRIDFTLGGIISLGAGLMILSTLGMVITSITYSLLQVYHPALAGEMFYLFTIFSSWLIVYNCYQIFRMFMLGLAFRLVHHFTWAESLNAAISFQSLATTQAKAFAQVLMRKEQTFIKTPKKSSPIHQKVKFTSILFELLLGSLMASAMLSLLYTVPSRLTILGYLFLGFWQVLIYASTIWRSTQSPISRSRSAI
jgi:cellulose synthase/poly-beta-1,6-N-acetylglucosamine synthase-like glycosyltransferase